MTFQYKTFFIKINYLIVSPNPALPILWLRCCSRLKVIPRDRKMATPKKSKNSRLTEQLILRNKGMKTVRFRRGLMVVVVEKVKICKWSWGVGMVNKRRRSWWVRISRRGQVRKIRSSMRVLMIAKEQTKKTLLMIATINLKMLCPFKKTARTLDAGLMISNVQMPPKRPMMT